MKPELILKNKDFLYPVLLCAFIALIVCINYFSFGNFIYDTGREFLVPELINEGQVPIKDIFLTYLPLSYQINALLFKIFGSSLDVLRMAGVFSSFITAIFIYFCAREFKQEKESFIVTLIVIFITMFNVSKFYNYVLGYSYAFIYGTAALFASIFFMLKYIKEEKFLYPSFFFLGVCLSLKLEYVFLIVPYLLFLFYKKTPFKKAFISLCLCALPLVLSFFALFIKGFNFSDLKNYFFFLSDFMHSKILKQYSYNVFIKNPVIWLLTNIKGFASFLFCFALSFVVLYFPEKFNKPVLYKFLSFVLLILFFTIALLKGSYTASGLFPWLCISSLFILLYSIKNKKPEYAFLALAGLFLAFRFNFIFNGGYCAYIMPPLLLLNIIFFTSFNCKFKKTLISTLLILSVLNVFYATLAWKVSNKTEIKTDKGTFIIDDKNEGEILKDTFLYLKGTKKEAVILVLPEGAMLNYLLNRKTNPVYYQLLPNHIEALGEENIVSELSENKPDYILIHSAEYSIYGTPYFGRDFGQMIYKFTSENYILDKVLNKPDSDFAMLIYKVKPLE